MTEVFRRKVLFVILGVLVLILIILVIIIYNQLKAARDQVGQPQQISATATASSNINVTYNLKTASPDENTDAVRDVANKFMQAKEDRSYDDAKPYMTDELQSKWNQESFAGTSSPSMDRFEISAVTKKDDKTYSASVTSYWLLNNQPAETVNYSLELTKVDSDFLVNKFDQI